MKNSHYVPRFILKKFSERLCIYNIKTKEFKENVKLEKAYAIKGFYDDVTEDNLNLKIESEFSKFLNDRILKCESTIELSRKELRLIKKFLLISIMRSVGTEDFMQKEKYFYESLGKIYARNGIDKNETEKERPFIEEKIHNETNREYWLRTINVILDTDGSPEEILKHPLKTYPAHRWATIVNAGYLAFWDSEYDRDEYVITDIGMTSENEKGWNGVTRHNTKKHLFLMDLLKNETNEMLKEEIIKQLNFVISFHENFEMFPISAKRMIVLIAPFYKFRQTYKLFYSMPPLEYLTELVNEELYFPNDTKYVLPQTGVYPKYHPNDKYIYSIKRLTRSETRYCNALFLDRINTTLGFSTLNKAVGSLLYYRRVNSYPYVPRVNYDGLYKLINEKYGGSLEIKMKGEHNNE